MLGIHLQHMIENLEKKPWELELVSNFQHGSLIIGKNYKLTPIPKQFC